MKTNEMKRIAIALLVAVGASAQSTKIITAASYNVDPIADKGNTLTFANANGATVFFPGLPSPPWSLTVNCSSQAANGCTLLAAASTTINGGQSYTISAGTITAVSIVEWEYRTSGGGWVFNGNSLSANVPVNFNGGRSEEDTSEIQSLKH